MVPVGNVVEEFIIGNTKVRICDDYCRDKTPEEVDAILKNIAETVRGPLIAAAEKKAQEDTLSHNHLDRKTNTGQI